MKKTLLIFAGLIALLAVSCTQEKFDKPASGKEVTVSFTAALPDAIATRAYSDGKTAKSLQYGVYLSGTDTRLFGENETVTFDDNLTATINLTLATGVSYDILFWAQSDATEAYSIDWTEKKMTVDYDSIKANDENNDAFYAFVPAIKVEGAVKKTVQLYRPFAQINLGTNDYAEAKAAGLEVDRTNMLVTLPNVLNFVDGSVEGNVPATFAVNTIGKTETFPVEGYSYLEMNYVLADSQASTANFTFNIWETGKEDSLTPNIYVSNVPVRRNYRTNIYGSLLTDPASITVIIVPEINTLENVEVVEVRTIEEVSSAIENGAKNITVSEIPETVSNIVLPPVASAETGIEVTISLPATSAEVTFSYETATPESGKGNLENVVIDAPSTENLTINLPYSHVVLNGDVYGTVNASVSATTLVVAEGVTVETLNILAGNAEIYGTVGSVTLAKGCAVKAYAVKTDADAATAVACNAVDILVGTADGLVALTGVTLNGGQNVKLTADIDLAGLEFAGLSAWNPENKNTFDGQGFTVSNVANTSKAADMGFIKSWTGTIKNVTIKDANFITKGRSAILAAKVYADIDNCHVVGGSIEDSFWACGAIAGLYNGGNITNCTVTGTTVKSNGGVGGIVGVINEAKGERRIEDCIVKDCEINNTGAYGADYAGGAICGMVNIKNSIVFFNGNKVENCNIDNVYGYKEEGTTVFVDGAEILADGAQLKNGVIEISNANGLRWFAEQVNVNNNSFEGKTVELTADIDLENQLWTPVGQTGKTQFVGVFDGKGHTISNLTINNTDDSRNCASGLFGWIEKHGVENYSVKNLVVDGANVYGHHNVGVIAGYLIGIIDGCEVKNATVSCVSANDDANGDKCGVIAGIAAETNAVIRNCTVSDSAVSAGRDAGQIVGACIIGKVENCSATNVTVTANGSSTGKNINEALIGRTN